MQRIVVCVVAVCAFLGAVSPAMGQAPDREGKAISQIRVSGNRAISAETVISKVKTKVGDSFNQEVLNDDLKRLYATEYFTDVQIDVEDASGGGVIVTFVVEEKTVVGDIVFQGNKAFSAQKLKSVMKLKVNDMLNHSLLAQDIAQIRDFYVKKGYSDIDVTYAIDVDKALNKSKIVITIDEKTRVKVSKVTITGNKAIKTKDITKVLGTRPAWLFNAGAFKEEVFQEDIEKIKALYEDKGYLDADVSPKLDYSADRTKLYITLAVTEGKLYRVGVVEVKGTLTLPEKDVIGKITLKTGRAFSDRDLRLDAMAVKQLYSRHGYMNAVVDIDRKLNPATGDIDVAFTIDAKNVVYVGKVDVRGNTKTKDIVVRRELRLYPGDKFNGDKLRRSKERLYNLGLFEDISFDTEPTQDPDKQNLVVDVKESKTGEFSFGGGYSSIDQLLGFVEVTQRNFDILNFPTFCGAGQNLSVKAELGMVRNNYYVSWTDPWILGYPYSFGFDLYRTSHRKKTDIGWPYDERRTGGDLRLGKELTEYLRADLVYKIEEVKIGSVVDNASADMRAEEGSNYISSGTAGVTYDTRDNIYSPTRGFIAGASIEDAGGVFGGDKDFVKFTSNAGIYQSFFGIFVLELRGRAGLANAYANTDEVPIYERFFAGGEETIRGYLERHVGPRDPGSNEPIGGEAIIIGNAEITFPIYEKVIKGAVFYDVGNVWRRAEDFIGGGNYKYGAGFGVRVKTPIGPFKLDYGYPLVGNYDDTRDGQFYFSISRGF